MKHIVFHFQKIWPPHSTFLIQRVGGDFSTFGNFIFNTKVCIKSMLRSSICYIDYGRIVYT